MYFFFSFKFLLDGEKVDKKVKKLEVKWMLIGKDLKPKYYQGGLISYQRMWITEYSR